VKAGPGGPPGHGSGIRESTGRGTHALVARLVREWEGCAKVLDLPCGRGAFLSRLAGTGVELHGGDVREVLEVPDARFAQVDMNEPLPFGDGSFDGVVCIDGIEHLERPFDFVRECARIVRPGGAFFLTTPNISALRSRWRWLFTGFHNKCKTPLDETDPNPLQHVHMLSFPDVRFLLHSSGFRIEAVHTNRIKAINWLYAPLVPFAWVATRLALAREKREPARRRRDAEIRRALFSRPILFGEVMVVAARRL